jgi:lipopolysaccharide biosynthesis glycosyltransferase
MPELPALTISRSLRSRDNCGSLAPWRIGRAATAAMFGRLRHIQMVEYIPIVFCFDETYSNYGAVAIFSVLSSSDVPVKIYCLVPSSDVEKMASIQAMNKILDSDITVIGADDRAFFAWKEVGHITRATYLRLFMPDLINEDKVIYLDADLIVRSDLSELFATSTDQFFIAGVPDPLGGRTSRMPRAQDDVYINGGVMVMNLKGLRQDRFLEKCARIYSSHPDLVTWMDQCLINKYAENRKTILDPRWNRQISADTITPEEWSDFVSHDSSSIIHFLGSTKPWDPWCNPRIAGFWRDYANKLQTELGTTLQVARHSNDNRSEPRSSGNIPQRRNSLCLCGSGKKYKHCHGAFG